MRAVRAVSLPISLTVLGACYVAAFGEYLLSDRTIHLDFFGIWSWARFESVRPAIQIYQHAAQQAFLNALDPAFPPMPFTYPPFYLVMIRPLGALSYPAAQIVWSGLTFAAYVTAIWVRPAGRYLAAGALAPACAINLMYGQNGFLTAALLLGGARLARYWPWAAGVLLGLLAYKPQFALLIAVALVAAGSWQVAMAAASTVLTTGIVSLSFVGVRSWGAWLRAMPDFTRIVAGQRARLLPLMPTGLADAVSLGLGDHAALPIQAACTVAAAWCVWRAFRDPRRSDRMRAAILAVATIVAAPYAFVYDLPLVAGAIALALRDAPRRGLDRAVMAWAWLLPGLLLLHAPPVAAVTHAALLAVLMRPGVDGGENGAECCIR